MSFPRLRVALGALVLFVVLPSPAIALPDIDSSVFESTKGCGCHPALQITWSESMHAKALTDPIFQHELELAIRATDGALGPFCNSCHAPVAVMAGQLTGLDHSSLAAVSAEAVTCDFCHQVSGAGRPGNASFEFASPDGTKRAQFDDAKSPVHETSFSEVHTKAEFCGMCHDVYHPFNDLPLEATYTEWLNGPYAAEGIVCQDCHMTPGPGVVYPNPGKAAAFGPDPDHIYLMSWAGGNVALGASDLAEERLQAAAQVSVKTPAYITPGSTDELEVIVTNVGAGHYLPTGLTELRQMWLEASATDDEGNVVMREEHRYGLEFGNDDGEHPVPLWEATVIAWDDRIPPRESRSYTYDLTMPESGAAHVEAVLYYRSVSEEIAEAAHVDVPTTTMTSWSATVYGSREAAADAARQDLSEQGDTGSVGFNTLAVAITALVGMGLIILTAVRKTRGKRASHEYRAQ
jgi:hypothetical protein